MAWLVTEPFIVEQSIDESSDTAKHPLGTIVRAKDGTYGSGEFIYLLGVASTAVGLLVQWNATTYQTTVVPSGTNLGVPVAVAMSANLAGKYGWYQISGNAVIKKTAVAFGPGVAVYLSATAGRVKAIASAGRGIIGAKTANLASVTTTTSTVVVTINRPAIQIATAAA